METSLKIALTLLVAIVLKISGIVIPHLNDASTVVETFLYLYFLYTKVPALLNHYFKTTIFKRDCVLRTGLVFVPLFLLLTMAVLAPSLFVGSIFAMNATLSFNAAQFFLVSFGGVMIASAVFSLRIFTKHNQTLERILRKTESQDDLQIDRAYLKSGGVKRFSVSWQISMEIASVAFAFFLFWFVMWVIDYAYLIFAAGWICYELLNYAKQTDSSRILLALNKIEKIEKKTLFLETFLAGGASGSEGANILMLGGVAILLSCLFLVVSLRYPFLFLSWLLFCGWYILIAAIEITRRSCQEINLIREKRRDEKTLREMPQENLAIFAVSLLFIIMTNSRVADNTVIQYQFWNYFPVKNFLISSLNPIMRTGAKLGFLFFANIVTVYSGIIFAKRLYDGTATTATSGYISDKLKLSWLCVLSVLLVVSAYSDVMLPLLLLVFCIIFHCFIVDLRSIMHGISAWKYGLLNILMASIVMAGALASLMIFSQYNYEANRFLQPLLFPLVILMSAMTILQGYACYRTQIARLDRTHQQKEIGR